MSLIGLLLALAAILGGNIIEGGHPSALLDLPAFLIVIGGTVGAALTQFPFSVVGKTFKRFKWLISPLRLDMLEQAQLLETLAGNARRMEAGFANLAPTHRRAVQSRHARILFVATAIISCSLRSVGIRLL